MAMESRVEGFFFAKQAAKGSPATAPSARTAGVVGRKVGGDANVNRDDGSENWSDGNRFPDSVDFVNTLVGDGNPVVQAQPDVAAYLAWLIAGQETVTGSADPWTHVATPAATAFWFTAWKRVGATTVLRQQFNDCRMTSLRIEGSSANKVVKLTPGFTSLDPGKTYATDPTVADSGIRPLLYTDGIGRYNVDGTNYSAASSFAVVINDATTPWYGDDVLPYDVTFGGATITLEALTLLLDATTFGFWNTQIYGSATPTAGTAPVKVKPSLGSFTADLQNGASRQLKVEVPGVSWSPDMAIAGNPDGGAIEIPLAGAARKSASNPMFRVTTKTDIAAFV